MSGCGEAVLFSYRENITAPPVIAMRRMRMMASFLKRIVLNSGVESEGAHSVAREKSVVDRDTRKRLCDILYFSQAPGQKEEKEGELGEASQEKSKR